MQEWYSSSYPHQFTIWLLQNQMDTRGWQWTMVNSIKQQPQLQLLIQISLLDHINMVSGTQYMAIDMANALFSISIRKENQKQSTFTWDRQQYTFSVFLRALLTFPSSVIIYSEETGTIWMSCSRSHWSNLPMTLKQLYWYLQLFQLQIKGKSLISDLRK